MKKTESTNLTPATICFLISLYDFKFPAELKAMQHIFLSYEYITKC
jgi:hypothetical protein